MACEDSEREALHMEHSGVPIDPDDSVGRAECEMVRKRRTEQDEETDAGVEV